MVASITANQGPANLDPWEGRCSALIGRTIQIASKWICEKELPGTKDSAVGAEIKNILIDSIHSEAKELRHVFYYRIVFATGFFDEAACIVLMDGSVLEPEPQRQK